MILEISLLIQRNTLKNAMQMQKFCFVLFSLDQTFRKLFLTRVNGLQKPLEIFHRNQKSGKFWKRLGKAFNGEFSRLLYITAILVEWKKISKIWVSLWGCPYSFIIISFRKPRKQLFHFFRGISELFILKGNIMLLLSSSICVLFYQSLSTRIKTYWKRFLLFYSLHCFALSNKWVKKVVLPSLKSSLRRKQLTR